MNGFKDARSIRATKRGAREHAERAHKHGCLVRKDIPEDITAEDCVELLRPTDELHGGVIDIHVRKLDRGEVLSHLYHLLPPKLTHIQDVCFVNATNVAPTFACNLSTVGIPCGRTSVHTHQW